VERRERRGEVAREALGQRLGVGRAPENDLGIWDEQGREEHQPLDVLEVEVGEQSIRRGRAASLSPSVRMPEPASSTRTAPSESVTSTQEILPP
jgi:hypothetical protein